jgi:hypothetical protein
MRIVSGIASLACAGLLAFHVIAAFRPVTLPTIRQLGQEQTFFYVLKFGPLSLSGLQIVVFEVVLLLLSIILGLVGYYALRRNG